MRKYFRTDIHPIREDDLDPQKASLHNAVWHPAELLCYLGQATDHQIGTGNHVCAHTTDMSKELSVRVVTSLYFLMYDECQSDCLQFIARARRRL
jgi:hypothetical protein